MYRKVTIKDLEGKEIELEVHVNSESNEELIKTQVHTLHLTFGATKALTSFLSAVRNLMDKNTINKIKIEEIT